MNNMLNFNKYISNINLKLESTLQDLKLWQVEMDSSSLGDNMVQLFDRNPLLPGIIMTNQGNYAGMISRSIFFDRMSRPYSLGLYSQRPIELLYNIMQPELFVLSGDTSIVAGIQQALERPSKLVYEPIVVAMKDGSHGVLDFHHLVVASSQVHILTLAKLQRTKEKNHIVRTNLRSLQDNYSRSLQNDKMISLGQLVAGIAHEINNPVTFIAGNLDHATEYSQDLLYLIHLYQKYYPYPEGEIQTVLQEIDLDFIIADLPKILLSMQVGTSRIQQIVLSLCNFSRLDEAEEKIIDIHEAIDNTLFILQSRLRLKFNQGNSINVFKKYDNLPLVECYPKQLNQVFLHILSNAIDALEEKAQHCQSQIEISAKLSIHIQTEMSDCKSLVIRITDNGFGMKNEIKRRIFDPFFTTKPVGKGTGMGLSICHQIVVEKHGGQLECISTPGKGTEFILQIPITITKGHNHQHQTSGTFN